MVRDESDSDPAKMPSLSGFCVTAGRSVFLRLWGRASQGQADLALLLDDDLQVRVAVLPAPEHDGWPRGIPRGQPARCSAQLNTKLSNDHRLMDAPVCLYCVPLWVIAIRSQTVPST
jgi:hypothetical protein